MAINIDFEEDKDFEIGINGSPRHVRYPAYGVVNEYPVFWDRGGWFWVDTTWGDPGWAKFEPETTIVRQGSRSAKLWLRDAKGSVNSGRLEVLMDYNGLNDVDLYNEVWYYIPSSTVANVALSAGLTIHRIIYERLWATDRPVSYQESNINLTIIRDGRSASQGQWMFMLATRGQVDNNNDGVNDFTGAEQLFSNDPIDLAGRESWNLQKVLVPFDRWFKVRSYVKRNLADYEDGQVKIWIDLNDGQGERLIWNLYKGAPPTGQGAPKSIVRTVGIDPSILALYPRYNPGFAGTPPYSFGFLCAGFGLYSSALEAGGHVFIDGIKITKGEYAPTPISPWQRLVESWNDLSRNKKVIIISSVPASIVAALILRRR